VTVYLDYREVNYSVINWGLTLITKSSAFKKEPVFSGSKVIRGTLQLGGSKSDEMGFAWDRAAGKLYLDLNRNLDLTDDPAGVFSCARGFNDSFQFFTNFACLSKRGWQPANAGRPQFLQLRAAYLQFGDAVFVARQGDLCRARNGSWALLANPIDQRTSLESGSLLLRPWGDRNKPFNLYGARWTLFRFRATCLWGTRPTNCAAPMRSRATAVKVQMQFTEQQPEAGRAEDYRRLCAARDMEGGPYLVVLDKPAGVVKVPVGRYGQAKVCFEEG